MFDGTGMSKTAFTQTTVLLHCESSSLSLEKEKNDGESRRRRIMVCVEYSQKTSLK